MIDCGCEGREPTNGRLGTVLRPTCQKTKQLHTQILCDLDKIKQWGGETKPIAYSRAVVGKNKSVSKFSI